MPSAPPIFRHPPEAAVRRLLAEAKLPSEDLNATHFPHFFGCGEMQAPQGVVGVEIHGEDALLRSLVVDPATRGRGCAKALVARAERHAQESGARRIFLLTTTAAEFFSHLGYNRIERDAAPQGIRATSQFSALCPTSSVLMMKELEWSR